MVAGWPAVFQVAVVGQAVAATAGEGEAKGDGPGTGVAVSIGCTESCIEIHTLVSVELGVDVDEDTLV